MAKSWEWNEDGTVITMKLRNDILWDDGTPLSAQDIHFSYTSSPTQGWRAHLGYVEYLKEGKRPLIVDDETIGTSHAYDRPRSSRTSGGHTAEAHPRGSDRASLRTHAPSKSPMSNGPWKLTAWSPTSALCSSPTTSSPVPTSSSRTSRRSSSRSSRSTPRMLELESGKIDMMRSILSQTQTDCARNIRSWTSFVVATAPWTTWPGTSQTRCSVTRRCVKRSPTRSTSRA